MRWYTIILDEVRLPLLCAPVLSGAYCCAEWRLPDKPPDVAQLESAERDEYATYIQILQWFMDDPSPACPFSVHRMALAGNELGKSVGEWFGPSTAAGAVK